MGLPKKAKMITDFSTATWDEVQRMFRFPLAGLDEFEPPRVPFKSPTAIDELIAQLTELESVRVPIDQYACTIVH